VHPPFKFIPIIIKITQAVSEQPPAGRTHQSSIQTDIFSKKYQVIPVWHVLSP
jgi:hypothetical protein